MTEQFKTPRAACVLLVDDEPHVRAVLARGLAAHGFVVWDAPSGARAIELLRQHPREIDAALVDLRMPGMDGLDTAAALKQVKRGLPCCVMSGGLTDDPRASVADRILYKPFSFADLAACFQKLLRG
jgi:CheY-like chemotaxis protein